MAEWNLGDRVHSHIISVRMCAEKYGVRRPLWSSKAVLSQASLTSAGQITSWGCCDTHGLLLTDTLVCHVAPFISHNFSVFSDMSITLLLLRNEGKQ